MSEVSLNKRVIRVVLDDLTREATYQRFADWSAFEGHMVDYETSPIRTEDDAQRRRRQTDARSEMRRAGQALLRIYPDGNTRAIKSITAEDDRVLAEYLVHAGRSVFDPDTEHNFHVLKVFELHRGQIVRMREYCDSAYLNRHAGPIAEFMHRTPLDDDGPAPLSAWSSDWCLAGPELRIESDGRAAPAAQLAAHKDVVRELTGAWGHESMAAHLHEEVFFTNEVDPATSPRLGRAIRGRDRLVAAARHDSSLFPGGLRRVVTAITAENNRVVIEEELTGTLGPQESFTTRLAKVCLLRDGLVHRIRQYVDSGYLQPRFPEGFAL
jgi:uncharacterized protein